MNRLGEMTPMYPIPVGGGNTVLRRSAIQGNGSHAAVPILKGARIDRPEVGVFLGLNFSCEPNARIIKVPLGVASVATRDIAPGEEITVPWPERRVFDCNCPSCARGDTKLLKNAERSGYWTGRKVVLGP